MSHDRAIDRDFAINFNKKETFKKSLSRKNISITPIVSKAVPPLLAKSLNNPECTTKRCYSG